LFIAQAKKLQFFLFTVCLLLVMSACQTVSSTPAVNTLPTSTATETTGAVPTDTTPASITSSCPTSTLSMPVLPAGSHPHVLYLSERGGLQTAMTDAQLLSYDLFTKSTTTLLSLANTDQGIDSAQLSTDGQWALFLTSSLEQQTVKVQVIRADGQMLQTVFCAPLYKISNVQWSPDRQNIAFAVLDNNGQATAIELLNLFTGQHKSFAVNNYRPYVWLNNMLLYIVQPQGNQLTSQMHLALLDTSKDSAPTNFTTIASTNALCGRFETIIDDTHLFSSSCTLVDVCRGPATQGPSTLNSLPATGGSATTIYQNHNQAIMTFHQVTAQTLLMYIENTQGDLSQNGLWKINTDGTGLTRLTTIPGQQCGDLGYRATYPQIVSSGQYYALRTVDATSQSTSLMVGNITGGVPTTFETKDIREGVLMLVGVALR
jgi:hypothetical protein